MNGDSPERTVFQGATDTIVHKANAQPGLARHIRVHRVQHSRHRAQAFHVAPRQLGVLDLVLREHGEALEMAQDISVLRIQPKLIESIG